MKASELWALSQEFTVKERAVVLTPSLPAQLCDWNTARVALFVCVSSSTSNNNFASTNPDITTGQGFFLAINGKPLELYFSQSGSLCQKAWYCTSGAPGDVLTVLEVLFQN